MEEFDVSAREVTGRTWLELMEGSLNWKIIGPDVKNPYGPILSYRNLLDLANRPEAVRRQLSLKCLVDGYEILMVINLVNPILSTDHPCLTKMSREELFEYIEDYGIEDRIQAEIKRIQDDVRQLLARKDNEPEQNSKSPRKNKKYKGKPLPRAKDSRYRIVRK